MFKFKYFIYLFIILICNISSCFRLKFNNLHTHVQRKFLSKTNTFPKLNTFPKTRLFFKINSLTQTNLIFQTNLKNNISNNELSMIGISEKNNSISNLEKISLIKNNLPSLYNQIIKTNIADEIIVLGTCNRFELYAFSSNATLTLDRLKKMLIESNDDFKFNSTLNFYSYKNNQVLKHLYSVSSGLDSLIFGEKQIECQIKKIIKELDHHKFYKLKNVFESSVKCSKTIRKIENFNKADTSIVSVCVDLFVNKINNSTKILIVGSGETSKILIKYFSNRKIQNLHLTNRNITNAIKLKNNFYKLNITLIDYLSWKKIINNYDYVFMATSSSVPLIKYNDINDNLNFLSNKTNPNNLTIIDLCMPKNVESKCKEIDYINLFDIADLKQIQSSNIQNNKIILDKSGDIINLHISKFNEL
jgi:glutamyl-tRNA reductase